MRKRKKSTIRLVTSIITILILLSSNLTSLIAYGGESKSVVEDSSIVLPIASWAGTRDWGDSKIAYGDKNTANDGLDTSSRLTVNVGGEDVEPYIAPTGTGTNYYQGSDKMISNDYIQLEVNAEKYNNLNLSFRLRASATAAKSYKIIYSSDNKNYLEAETITLKTKGTYQEFQVKLPEAVKDSVVYIRLVAGDSNFSGTAPKVGGTLRLQDVLIEGSPLESNEVCGIVSITPDAGEISIGTELTMTTSTELADILYSFDGTNYNKYDEKNKPVVTSLPITVTAYAVKDGMEESIKTTNGYTQIQATAVKATPNGGAVSLKSKVKLSSATDGAKIMYSYDGSDWKEYSSEITLSKLPVTIYTKSVKDGYLDSPITTLSYTEKTNKNYNTYFGQLHSHSSYSDGAGSCEEAFQYASTKAKQIDFLAVTDHSNSFDNADKASLADGSVSSEWVEGHELAKKYTTDKFVAMYGFEMTWSNGLGHMNTFNTDGFQSRTQSQYSSYATALQNYYATLRTDTDSISQFNHPGTTFGDFNDFSYYDEEIDNLITLIEVGNGEGAIGSSGYFPSYEYYTRALDKGWHVAPTNNQDNHKGLWGDANTARTVVLADTLTEENIYDAMRNRRVYSTEDNDLSITYTLDDNIMGTILEKDAVGDKINISVDISDPTDSEIGKVEVIANGGLSIASKNISKNKDKVDFTLGSNYSYYYIKITQKDGDIAVTAPVWVGEVEAAGINNFSTNETLPVAGEELDVTLELYNNEKKDLDIDSIQFTVGDKIIHNVNLKKSELTSIKALDKASYTFKYKNDSVGLVELNAIVKGKLKGVEKVYSSVLKLNYSSPKMVTNVIVDGTHGNDYVSGYYGGNVGNFKTIAADNSVRVNVVTDKITDEMLDTCSLLVISAPARKSGTSNFGDFNVSYFEDEFIEKVKSYVAKGGNVVVCGIADYQDSKSSQTSKQINKLLKAIGSTITLNSDELYDEENNGGQNYRLYLNKFNKDSEYVSNIVDGQTYSAYSGCSVNITDAMKETDNAYPAQWIVKGHDTTYSIDSRDDEGNILKAPYTTVVEKGDVVTLASQKTKAGGEIFVAGTVFISDFEVKAEMDNIWDVPYANKTIAENILDSVKVELPITDISEVRKGKIGDVYAIEGYVTAGTAVEGCTFFDTIYVQDETGGITIFPYADKGLEIGTKIRIVGYVDQYQGDIELQILSYEILDNEPNKIINPIEVSSKEAMDYAKNGGKLIKVNGEVVEAIYGEDGVSVSQFRVKDKNGDIATVFIDGYILSSVTGKNDLASIVKVGDTVSAVGLLYLHPEGSSEESVPCLRVRNCDEIKLVSSSDNSSNNDNSDNGNVDNSNNNNSDNSDVDNSSNTNSGNSDVNSGSNNDNSDNTNNSNKDNSVSNGNNNTNTNNNTNSNKKDITSSLKTGDNNSFIIYLILIIVSGAILTVTLRKKVK